MAPIGGPYPGGPRRPSEEPPEGEERVRLETAEEIEGDRQSRASRRKERRRRRRIGWALAAVVLAAVVMGIYLGLNAGRSPEDIAREEERAQQEESILERERNRMLRELWKMEEMERAVRGPP